MRRRLRKTALGSLLIAEVVLAVAVTVEAQQPKKVPRIGCLTAHSTTANGFVNRTLRRTSDDSNNRLAFFC